jgi:hypothetical protein
VVEILISWLYMALICGMAGAGINEAAGRHRNIPSFHDMTAFQCIMTGITALTVYAEIFSIFGRVSVLCHVIMLILAASGGWYGRKYLSGIFRKTRMILSSWEGVFYILTALTVAFYTSRGTFHTDTGIYHAQAIRIFEEYGLIRGSANLQLHFGYNSAYFAFCALFTGSSILPSALHATTGFIELVCMIYAFRNIRNYLKSSKTVTCASAAIIIYAVINIMGSMSPATDYVTLFMALYIFTEWTIAVYREQHMQSTGTDSYIMPALMAVFLVSMKLSTGPVVLLAVYPLVCLIRRKQWGKILWSSAAGMILLIPYLVRNVLISGWLLYPFDQIDLFNVEWKVPAAYLQKDSAQIEVWGKALFDVTKQNMPMSQWVPIWWGSQEHYDQMLIYAMALSAVLIAGMAIGRIKAGKRINGALITMYAAMLMIFALWFVKAPFVRYGLEILLALPLITAGIFLDSVHGQFSVYFGGTVFVLILICFAPTLDHYATDDLVFIKHNFRTSYYIRQQPFDDNRMGYVELNGNKIYYPLKGEVNSYYYCPSTCYKMMLDRSELIGDTIKSGFRAKEQ